MVTDAGRVLAVTGGASGIGRATAQEWIASGGRAGVLDITATEGGVVADVRDESAVAAGLATIAERYGRLDAVAHCAGILGPPVHVEDFDVAQWRDMVDVHLTAAMLLAKHALPHLTDGGSFVFVSSISTMRGSPSHPTYAAVKGALEALARSLARSLGPRRVRVNVVAPGSITGTGLAPVGNAELTRLMAASPLRRLGRAEDVARTICFLCSERSAHLTGATLVVDGGESLGR